MKTLDTYTINFPTWGLSALINDDYSSLNDEEIRQVNEFKHEFYELAQTHPEKDALKTGFVIWSDTDQTTFFCKSPEFGLACDCVELEVLIVC